MCRRRPADIGLPALKKGLDKGNHFPRLELSPYRAQGTTDSVAGAFQIARGTSDSFDSTECNKSRVSGAYCQYIGSDAASHEYFRLSGIREHKKLGHSPFLVFLISNNTVEVRIVDNAKTLLDFADETQVMSQWRGQWRSDYFHFKVGDLRRYVAEHPAEKYYVV
jgi:hypothetical protein